MFYALDSDGKKVGATPGGRAYCPLCESLMIAKCGEINIWHWSHEASTMCDEWTETESDWHYEWKKLLPREQVEVLIEKNGVRHYAPMIRRDGTIVELRSSYISPAEIREREDFYSPTPMRWLFDIRDAAEKGRIDLRPQHYGHSFRWKHPHKYPAFAKPRTAFLDLAEKGILLLVKLHIDQPPHGGWGNLSSQTSFVEWLCSNKRAA